MRAASDVQYEAFERGEAPPAERVREGIWSLPSPMPMRGDSITCTLCYLVEDADGSVHLVDAGVNHPVSLGALEAGFELAGHTFDDLASLTVTHLHIDHLGAAGRLRELTGARIVLGAGEQDGVTALQDDDAELTRDDFAAWGVPADRQAELLPYTRAGARPDDLKADRVVRDGDLLDIPGRSIRVVETPGHTSGSLSLAVEEEGLVLTGDALLPVTNSGIGLGAAGADPVGAYLGSLERLASLDEYEAAPGHEYRFFGVAERAGALARHHLRRSIEVARVLSEDPAASTWQIASRVPWGAGFGNLKGYYLRSALMQTRMHVEFVAGESFDRFREVFASAE